LNRPAKIGLWSIGCSVLVLFAIGLGFNLWQYWEANRLFRETRDFEVGKEMTAEQLKRLESRRCGARDLEHNPNAPGTWDLIFNCQVLHLNLSGFYATTSLHIDLTFEGRRLVSKSAIIFYDGVPYFGSRAISVRQSKRGYGYQGMPDESVPNRWRDGTRFEDGSYKGFVLREDDTVSAEQRKLDWNLNLRCMWTERACLSYIADELAKESQAGHSSNPR
jgi:hypothetical protein